MTSANEAELRSDALTKEALANKPLYQRLQLLDYLGLSLWQFSLTLFLMKGLGCSTFQVGLIIAGGFIFQVALEIPSGIIGDVFSHRLAIIGSSLCSLFYPVLYLGLFMAKHQYDEKIGALLVQFCLAIEFVFAVGTALQSGSVETWASEPIRKLQKKRRRGVVITPSQIEEWYAKLESGAKSRMTWGFLGGGVVSYLLLALGTAFSQQEHVMGLLGENGFWAIPWVFALVVYSVFVKNALSLLHAKETSERGEFHRLLNSAGGGLSTLGANFVSGFRRIVKISIDYCLEVDERESGTPGRRFFRLTCLNALLYFGLFMVTVFWAPVTLDVVTKTLPRLPTFAHYSILACVWGAISCCASLGAHLVDLVGKPPTDRAGKLHASLFLAFGVLFAGLYFVSSATPSTWMLVFAVFLLACCKFLEGYIRPVLSILLSIVLPESRTRASLLSFESWVRTITAGVLFIAVGAVAQADLSYAWLFAAVVMAVALVTTLFVIQECGFLVSTLVVFSSSIGGLALIQHQTSSGIDLSSITATRPESALGDGGSSSRLGPSQLAILRMDPMGEGMDVLPIVAQGEEGTLDGGAAPHEWSVEMSTSHPWSRVDVDRSASVQPFSRLVSARFAQAADSFPGEYTWEFDYPYPLTIELENAAGSLLPTQARTNVPGKSGRYVSLQPISIIDVITALIIILAVLVFGVLLLNQFTSSMRAELEMADSLGHFREYVARENRPGTRQDDEPIPPLQAVAKAGHETSNRILDMLQPIDIVGYGVASAGRLTADGRREYKPLEKSWFEAGSSLAWEIGSPPLLVPDEPFDEFKEEDGSTRVASLDSELLGIMAQAGSVNIEQFAVLAYPIFDFEEDVSKEAMTPKGLVFFVQNSPYGITAHEHFTLEAIGQLLGRITRSYYAHVSVEHREANKSEARMSDISDELELVDQSSSPMEEWAFWGETSSGLLSSLQVLQEIRIDQAKYCLEPSVQLNASIRLSELESFLHLCARSAIAANSPSEARLDRQARRTIEIRLPRQSQYVRGNPELPAMYLWQALENLMSNGLHHGSRLKRLSQWPSESILEVIVEERDGEVSVTFLDSGPGIPIEIWEQLVLENSIPRPRERKGLWLAAHSAIKLRGRLEQVQGRQEGRVFPRLCFPTYPVTAEGRDRDDGESWS